VTTRYSYKTEDVYPIHDEEEDLVDDVRAIVHGITVDGRHTEEQDHDDHF
jgi:hypothetical protein